MEYRVRYRGIVMHYCASLNEAMSYIVHNNMDYPFIAQIERLH